LALPFCILLHVFALLQGDGKGEVEITLRAQHLTEEVCEALAEEQTLLLDGRFALYKIEQHISPSLLRFYDVDEQCEFTVPSKKYSDLEITLYTVAREHPFGMALYGVRTVNVGMHLSLFGEKTKVYATCIGIQPLKTPPES
jgi:hypothetical protein